MSWFACPVCSTNNAPKSIRCSSCGADFTDVDVMAMMGQDMGSVLAPEIAAGSLAHSNFLGFSRDSLEDGRAVRKLAVLGALMLLGAFLIPVSSDYRDSLFAWKALDHAPSIALLFPLLAAVMALVAAFAPLENWQRSLVLVLAGMGGIATLPFLGNLSGSPEKLMPLISLGLVVAAWGLILRSFDSQSDLARKLIIGGALVAVIGFFIPMAGADSALPIELRFYLNGEIGTGSAFTVYKTVFNKDPLVFFSTVYLFLPLVLLPLAAAASWPKPKEAWDKMALFIKPVAWFVVLYLPIGFALFAFNLLGNEETRVIIDGHYLKWEEFTSAALKGRFRLLLLAAGFSAFATLPFVGVAAHFFPAKNPTQKKADSGSGEDESPSV